MPERKAAGAHDAPPEVLQQAQLFILALVAMVKEKQDMLSDGANVIARLDLQPRRNVRESRLAIDDENFIYATGPEAFDCRPAR